MLSVKAGDLAGGVLGHAHRRRCGRWAGGAGGVLDYTETRGSA